MTEQTKTNPAQDTSGADTVGRILDRLEAIEARLSRFETAPAPAEGPGLGRLVEDAGARARAAWTALASATGQAGGLTPTRESGASASAAVTPSGRGLLATAGLIVLALAGVLLALEVAEQVFDGLRHLLRRLF